MSSKSSRRRLKKKKKPRKRQEQQILHIDYYQPVFYLLIQSIAKTGYPLEAPHSLRNSFWKLIPYDRYLSYQAREIVLQYGAIVEKELSSILSRHSIAYWLHVYRRLLPMPFGPDKDPKTTILNRVTLEAAIQKYGRAEQCNRVGVSNQVPEESILRGVLMAPEFKGIRAVLKSEPQLVLTEFGIEELIEFYEIEKLAFELWRCGATLRALGKGAVLRVVDDPVDFYEDRTEELDKLINSYDERGEPMGVSATGTVFPQYFSESFGTSECTGILLPTYNVHLVPLEILNSFFAEFYGYQVPPETISNFIWFPFNLGGYFYAHKPFAGSFENTHGIPLSWIIGVIGALAYRVFCSWRELGFQGLYRYYQRAYEGPFERAYVINEIEAFLGITVERFGLGIDPARVDVSLAVRLLELNDEKREMIDILLGGPHSIFLPFNDDRIFIDYGWCLRILYSLFYRIKVSDQNFKGNALEQIVHKGESALPTGKCYALNGENRQIDAAFEVDGILLIVECRAVARSLGFDRGDPTAIQYRIDLINRTLSDVDEKAHWLARNPEGTNYNIRKYRAIIPIGVTPFVEYIPSIDAFYWIDTIPRVLTRDELKRALEDGTLKEAAMKSPNCVTIPC